MALSGPFAIFNARRRALLKLYPGVADTLAKLRARGVIVVGHTEAMAVNAIHRLTILDVVGHFSRLYALEGRVPAHPVHGTLFSPEALAGFLEVVPRSERKPNPRLLLDICSRMGVAPAEACYVGDSLTRDVAMAKDAGVLSVWARYGTRFDKEHWGTLVRVTHWTQEDRAIDEFSELLRIVGGDE
jgi:phosphoglycolate phosphatase